MSEEKTLREIAYETWCYDISHDAWQAVADAVVAAHEARKDNDELDGTDAAHPAWWRGNDAGVAQVCAQINAILDGADVSGTASEPWESTRRRVAEARKDRERLDKLISWCTWTEGQRQRGIRVVLDEAVDAARGAK